MTYAMAMLVAGTLLLTAAIKNRPVLDILRGITEPAPGGGTGFVAGSNGSGAGGKVGDAIDQTEESKVSGTTRGGKFKEKDLRNFEGTQVAAWIYPQLVYARKHGWKGPVTSGYRSHAYNVAQGRNYTSEHEFTNYPHGAVDFGGMNDAAGLANREAFFKALKGYRGKKLRRPVGFRDDGHASGTGH